MRKTAILIIMCGAVAVAQMLPGDGAKVTMGLTRRLPNVLTDSVTSL